MQPEVRPGDIISYVRRTTGETITGRAASFAEITTAHPNVPLDEVRGFVWAFWDNSDLADILAIRTDIPRHCGLHRVTIVKRHHSLICAECDEDIEGTHYLCDECRGQSTS